MVLLSVVMSEQSVSILADVPGMYSVVRVGDRCWQVCMQADLPDNIVLEALGYLPDGVGAGVREVVEVDEGHSEHCWTFGP